MSGGWRHLFRLLNGQVERRGVNVDPLPSITIQERSQQIYAALPCSLLSDGEFQRGLALRDEIWGHRCFARLLERRLQAGGIYVEWWPLGLRGDTILHRLPALRTFFLLLPCLSLSLLFHMFEPA